MIIAGIDNGLNGAVATVDSESNEVDFLDDYTIKSNGKNVYDIVHMVETIQWLYPDMVYIEKAQAMSKQGVTSTFSTGYGFGLWLGILSAFKIPYEIVSPKVWQKEFFEGKNKNNGTKQLSYQVSSCIYPDYAKLLLGPKGGLIDGRCDALLIATYGLRRQTRR